MSADGLAAAEAVLTEALDDVPASLREPCRRLARAGGERLRAGLLLAVAGRAWPGTSRRTAVAAAAVELLHLAALVHEDLLHEAPVRHGVPTVNAKEGTTVALLAGDLLIGLAHRLGATAGAGTLLSDALTGRCTGLALETDSLFHPETDATTALRIAELKTGTLLAAAGRLGAVVTASPEDGLQEYGLAYGTALHLLDDVRDPGSSFAAGIVTLPAVHALAVRPELRRLLRPGLDEAHRQQAGELLALGGPPTTTTIAQLLDLAEAARPDLAGTTKRCRDSQLALMPRHRPVLNS
ncbi:polyprenyl synthetase family protein [Actinoplanes sp. NPDC004185]